MLSSYDNNQGVCKGFAKSRLGWEGTGEEGTTRGSASGLLTVGLGAGGML